MISKNRIREALVAALFGLSGAAVSAAALSMSLTLATHATAALAVHAIGVPIIFGFVAMVYFRRESALAPLAAGAVMASVVLGFDLGAGLLLERAFSQTDVLGLLPATLTLVTTWITGLVFSDPMEHTAPSMRSAD